MPTTRRPSQADGLTLCAVKNFRVRIPFAGKREADESSALHLPAFHPQLRLSPGYEGKPVKRLPTKFRCR